ncbi:MAG: hypothetical protein IKZ53_00875 [Selenomonadaceae bacterium]|nr:hypothetical protein [Selenomonadaceae bacterium]
MIPALLALGAIVGGYLVVTNWQEIEGWLKEFLPKLQSALKETGIDNYMAKLFSSIEGNVMRLVHRLYYKENGKWVEKTTVREIDESEVPAWAKEGLSAKESDVTARYEKELELSV